MAAPKVGDIFKCEHEDTHACQTLVEFIQACGEQGDVLCCGAPMTGLQARAEDTGAEKHVPVVTKADGGLKVAVGDVPHPMEEEHHIVFIEVKTGADTMRHMLRPGEAPEAIFPIQADPADVQVREYCNKHGLWRAP